MLGYRDSEVLAGMLGCDAGELRHETVPRRKPAKRKPRRRPPLGAPLAAIPEIEVTAGAGPGALNEEFAAEKACWYLPESMVRHESGADPEHLRILRVRGNSMEPEMSEGDRLMVDNRPACPYYRRDVRVMGWKRACREALSRRWARSGATAVAAALR